MSRKTRSSEVLEQLGEPLPLPYMADLPKQKEEDSQNESFLSSTNPLAEQLKRRKVRISSGESRGESPPLVSENTIKKRRLRQIEAEIEQETIFDEIQHKLVVLKQKSLSNTDLQLDQEPLQEISRTIDDLLNRYNENDILSEIDRLRVLEVQSNPIPPQNTKLWASVIIFAVSCLLITSFLLGQFSYEYCYYFC